MRRFARFGVLRFETKPSRRGLALGRTCVWCEGRETSELAPQSRYSDFVAQRGKGRILSLAGEQQGVRRGNRRRHDA